MPELPEVETIVRGLRRVLIGREISDVEVRLQKTVLGSKEVFISSLQGRKIVGAERRGKFILLHLSDGRVLVIHLGMTGRLLFFSGTEPLEKHTHVFFRFASARARGPAQLHFVDQRQFGRMSVGGPGMGGGLDRLSRLGPEPLDISSDAFIRRARTRHREIKPLLLDQTFLAGVGNIYADEALYRARIHPRRRADSLSPGELLQLHRSLRRILKSAIRAGGTSVRNYVDAKGSSGAFQKRLRVYGRKGKPCPACGIPLVREWIGGRGTFFCPRCQQPERMPGKPARKMVA